ncbi:MAG: polysaccharide deacetylase family protein [Lysobacteraceae bacterium]
MAAMLAVPGSRVASKPVVLTFDDGPENARDDRAILRILHEHGAHAIWFVTCARLDPGIDPHADRHRAILRQVVAEGHLVGNHGYSHLDLTRLDAGALAHEIGDCSTLIRQVTGFTPRLFRPPFGRHTPAIDAAIRHAGLQALLWSANSYDSLRTKFKAEPRTFVAFLRANPGMDIGRAARPGDVVLMHDYPNTALALDDVLTRMQSAGLRLGLPGPARPAPSRSPAMDGAPALRPAGDPDAAAD